jgi:hypothetical protein
LWREHHDERWPGFAAMVVNLAADVRVLANAGLAKQARIGQTVEQPKCAVADSAKGDAIGRNAGFRVDAPEEDPTLPRLQKTVPIAGRAPS